jgi:two-component system chemotaxis response regulator CheB
MDSVHGQHPDSSPRQTWVIALAASAGGISALTQILGELHRDLPAAVVIVLHRSVAGSESLLAEILARASRLPVADAVEGAALRPGVVYIARPDLHLTVSADQTFEYVDGRKIRHVLSSANPLFESAAAAFDGHAIGVVLSGGGADATDGVQAVKAHGGLVIAQSPSTAASPGMPAAAVQSGAVDFVLPLEAIGPALNAVVHGYPVRDVPLT